MLVQKTFEIVVANVPCPKKTKQKVHGNALNKIQNTDVRTDILITLLY